MPPEFPLPEPENPGVLVGSPDQKLPEPQETNDFVNISDESNDIFTVGRSPLWDGDPVYDRALLFPHEAVETPVEPEVAPQGRYSVRATPPKPTGTVMPESSVCGYCQEEYKLRDGHLCTEAP